MRPVCQPTSVVTVRLRRVAGRLFCCQSDSQPVSSQCGLAGWLPDPSAEKGNSEAMRPEALHRSPVGPRGRSLCAPHRTSRNVQLWHQLHVSVCRPSSRQAVAPWPGRASRHLHRCVHARLVQSRETLRRARVWLKIVLPARKEREGRRGIRFHHWQVLSCSVTLPLVPFHCVPLTHQTSTINGKSGFVSRIEANVFVSYAYESTCFSGIGGTSRK